MTRRRWIAEEWDEGTATLRGEQAAHLIRVLRAQKGMECDVVTGERVWHASISEVDASAVRFALLHEVEAETALPLTILLAIFKFDRMEWVLEKATELGAERIIPVIARRSEKHLAQAAPARVERWRRLVHEAAKQSRRSNVPVVENPLPVREAIQIKAAQPGVNLFLNEQERSTTLYAALSPLLPGTSREGFAVSVSVGPEGGWTPEEDSLFRAENWQSVTLGPRILRAETAAIAAVAVVSALLS
jgi:16S rRNA (uracil1498-N3)-methyltransferase